MAENNSGYYRWFWGLSRCSEVNVLCLKCFFWSDKVDLWSNFPLGTVRGEQRIPKDPDPRREGGAQSGFAPRADNKESAPPKKSLCSKNWEGKVRLAFEEVFIKLLYRWCVHKDMKCMCIYICILYLKSHKKFLIRESRNGLGGKGP